MIGHKKPQVAVLLVCCLGMFGSGCIFHRTPSGFALQNPWRSQDHQLANSQEPGDRDAGDIAGDAPVVDRDEFLAKDQPELLPWRSRLRNSRLGARLARGRDAVTKEKEPEDVAPTATASSTEKPASKGLTGSADPAKGISRTKKPAAPEPETDELQLPTSVGLLPEPNRPTLAIDY